MKTPTASHLRAYLVTLPVILVAVLVAHVMQPYFDRTNVVMVYMLAVVVVAFRLGGGPAAMACLLSVFLYDFINVPPYFSFGTEAFEYLFTLLVMFITAGIISTLAGRLRQKAAESQEREARSSALYALSAELAGQQADDDILACTRRHLARTFQADVEWLRPAQWPPQPELPTAAELLRAPRVCAVLESRQCLRLWAPLLVDGRLHRVAALAGAPRWLETREQQEHLLAMLGQCAQAMERSGLRSRVQEKELLIEKESLRNSILNTVSHDLRTPLASIIGASSSLLAEGDSFSVESRQLLRTVIYEEATHLLHMVENLLDLARFQGGDSRLAQEWEAPEEIVGSAVAAIRRRVRSHEIAVEVPHDLPFVRCDSVLVERVIINLLENAVKYSPSGTVVRLTAGLQSGQVTLSVADTGPGIPVEQRERVFDPFYRLNPAAATGGGLGLTLCRSIIIAHGGQIWIDASAEAGTVVHFTLPLAAQVPVLAGTPEPS